MNPSDLTVVILTLDEEENIGRLLERLTWAPKIVVLDSGSTDKTLEIISRFPNATVHSRVFTGHASQWNAAIELIDTDWALALDADYIPSEDLASELASLSPRSAASAYRADFVYSIFGRPLTGSLYPSLPIFFRPRKALFYQEGHANKLRVDGEVQQLRARIFHDDRKSLDRWVRSQISYMKLEKKKLGIGGQELSWPDKLRRSHLLAPLYAFVYVLFVKRSILDGRAGFYYAYQRLFAEVLLSLELLDDELRNSKKR